LPCGITISIWQLNAKSNFWKSTTPSNVHSVCIRELYDDKLYRPLSTVSFDASSLFLFIYSMIAFNTQVCLWVDYNDLPAFDVPNVVHIGITRGGLHFMH
jgi:hypothetical protein